MQRLRLARSIGKGKSTSLTDRVRSMLLIDLVIVDRSDVPVGAGIFIVHLHFHRSGNDLSTAMQDETVHTTGDEFPPPKDEQRLMLLVHAVRRMGEPRLLLSF